MKAWALIAVSSTIQKKTLEDQKRHVSRFAAECKLTITREFEGVSSGNLGVRKTATELLDALRMTKDRPDEVLAVRLDRIGRGDILDLVNFIHDLGKLGVKFRTPEIGVIDTSKVEGIMMAVMLAGAGNRENETKRDNRARITRARREQGIPLGNRMPYGLRFVKDSQPRVIEDQAETIREIFRMRADGYGIETIALRIAPNAAPHRTADGNETPKSFKWTRLAVHRILHTEIYVPLIVDEVTAARVKRVTANNFRQRLPKKFSYPLAGTLRCFCGEMMVGIPSGVHRTYRCRNKLFHSKRICIRCDQLETEFLLILKQLAANKDLLKNFKQRSDAAVNLAPALRQATVDLEEVNRKQKRIVNLYAEEKIDKAQLQSSLDDYASHKATIETLVADLKMRIALEQHDASQEADVKALLDRSVATYEDASPDDQRLIVQAVSGQTNGLYVDADRHLKVGQMIKAVVS